jgi:1-acyl-sn-glycerol-3-phosphate acyltransferase
VTRYPPWGMLGPAAIARWALRTQTSSVRVEGLDAIPATGPVMLVARHFHHLLDGALLVRYVPRPVHIVVGLDWAADAKQRAWMERACNAAQYPVVLRAATLGQRGGYARNELARYTRSGTRAAVTLLGAGRVVVVFPEGYPNVDPAFAQKHDDDAFLPFAPGYLRMIAWAQRASGVRVAVVPVGFHYTRPSKDARWSIVARIGAARFDPSNDDIERAVRRLSGRNKTARSPE